MKFTYTLEEGIYLRDGNEIKVGPNYDFKYEVEPTELEWAEYEEMYGDYADEDGFYDFVKERHEQEAIDRELELIA